MAKNLFQLSDKLLKKVPSFFDLTEDMLNADIETITKWIESHQPHLPEIMDKTNIRNFLILNKCSVEETKRKIDMYYTIRGQFPEFFEAINPKIDHMKQIMDLSYFVVHPVLFQDKYRVFFFKLKQSNTLAPRPIAMQCYNIQEIRLFEDCMLGEVVICDLDNVSLNDILEVTPAFLSKAINIHRKVFSLRLKAMYIINSSSYVDTFVSLLKSSMKPKIYERIEVHQDAEILNEIFSKEVLPKDYGGDGPSLEELNDMLKLTFDQYQSRFDKLDLMRVDEGIRPEELKNDEHLGFHGNFKKLNVE